MEKNGSGKIDFVKALEEKGIKPTLQRVKILQYLVKINDKHPTVDTIYQGLYKKIPTLSKATVYNSLDLFEASGLIRRIHIGSNDIRYDSCTDRHSHFKCIKCNEVYDFSMDPMDAEEEKLSKHQILDKVVFYSGICEKCLAKEKDTKK